MSTSRISIKLESRCTRIPSPSESSNLTRIWGVFLFLVVISIYPFPSTLQFALEMNPWGMGYLYLFISPELQHTLRILIQAEIYMWFVHIATDNNACINCCPKAIFTLHNTDLNFVVYLSIPLFRYFLSYFSPLFCVRFADSIWQCQLNRILTTVEDCCTMRVCHGETSKEVRSTSIFTLNIVWFCWLCNCDRGVMLFAKYDWLVSGFGNLVLSWGIDWDEVRW